MWQVLVTQHKTIDSMHSQMMQNSQTAKFWTLSDKQMNEISLPNPVGSIRNKLPKLHSRPNCIEHEQLTTPIVFL